MPEKKKPRGWRVKFRDVGGCDGEVFALFDSKRAAFNARKALAKDPRYELVWVAEVP